MKTLSILFSPLLLALSGSAMAETYQPPSTQNHNGNECVNYYGNDASRFDHDIWGIHNLSKTTARYVSCPIVETEPFFTGLTAGTFNLEVLWSGQGTITCNVTSHSDQGGFFRSQSASRTGTGWFTIPNVQHDNSTVRGKYSMHCLLPPDAYLSTYQARLRVNF